MNVKERMFWAARLREDAAFRQGFLAGFRHANSLTVVSVEVRDAMDRALDAHRRTVNQLTEEKP